MSLNNNKKCCCRCGRTIKDSEECSPETKSRNRSLKNRILPIIKRKIEEKIITPFNEGLTEDKK